MVRGTGRVLLAWAPGAGRTFWLVRVRSSPVQHKSRDFRRWLLRTMRRSISALSLFISLALFPCALREAGHDAAHDLSRGHDRRTDPGRHGAVPGVQPGAQ